LPHDEQKGRGGNVGGEETDLLCAHSPQKAEDRFEPDVT